MIRLYFGAAAVALLGTVALTAPSFAAGAYDGTWVVDVPSAGTINGSNNMVCPALRIPVQIRDNEVTGTLQRVETTTGAVIVEAGNNNASAGPVAGTVAPDGTVNAHWQNYRASGKLGPQTGQVTIRGECGPRIATAIRISPVEGTTEGQGSSVPTYPSSGPGVPVPPNPSR
jgi:hypothetical protein